MADRYHPLPTQEHILRGNPSKKKLEPEREPKTEIISDLPDPPIYFGEYAIREWERSGPYLIRNKMLKEEDIAVFESYCMNIQLLIESAISIKDEGLKIMGARGWVKNPAVSAFGQATTAIRGFAAEFGLSPSARSRIKLPTEDGDVLSQLMGDDGGPDDFNEGV